MAFAQFKFGDGDDRSQFRHFVQLGAVRGTVSFGGEHHELADGLALRDRSWGLRRARERQGLHLWLQHTLASTDICLIYNERRDGSVAYRDGAVVDDEGQHRIVAVGHDLDFVPETRDVSAAHATVVDDRGRRHELAYERLLPGYVGGVGYGGWAGAEHPDGSSRSVTSTPQPGREILATQPILLFDHLCQISYGQCAHGRQLSDGDQPERQLRYAPRVAAP